MESEEDKKSLWQRMLAVFQRIPGAALMFSVVPLLVLGYLGWFFYGADHLDQALYALHEDNLSITQQPEWIQKSDILLEVFQHAGLDRISLLDPTATATIAQAFEAHNWVKSAARVTKTTGGQVSVDLIYRRPVAMVYYEPRGNSPLSKDATEETGPQVKEGFYPIDSEGIILPLQDFTRDDVWKYFMIFAKHARPVGAVGMSFGDARISEALELCSRLDEHRKELGLQQIWIEQDSRSAGRSPWVMTIITQDKHEIHWGHAPNSEAIGEPSSDEKIQQMMTWLESARQQSSRQQIDLLHGAKELAQPVSGVRG